MSFCSGASGVLQSLSSVSWGVPCYKEQMNPAPLKISPRLAFSEKHRAGGGWCKRRSPSRGSESPFSYAGWFAGWDCWWLGNGLGESNVKEDHRNVTFWTKTKGQRLVLESEATPEVPLTCILSTDQQVATPLVAKILWLYWSLWENDPTSNLICYFCKVVPNYFMVYFFTFKSSSIQHDIYFMNCGPI